MLEKMMGYIIPVVSILLTYILGRLQANQSEKKAALKQAYEALYLPFITLLYETNIWDIGFAKLRRVDQVKLFRIVTSNIQYMDKSILDLVDVFYALYGTALFEELEGIPENISPIRLDEIFDDLVAKVLIRAKWLAKKLHQPPLGEFVLELYLDAQAAREK